MPRVMPHARLCKANSNTDMTCYYNRGLSFSTSAQTSRDVGWSDGRAWAYVSNLQTPDYCRIVNDPAQLRCSRISAPGKAGALFTATDLTSGNIDSGYREDRFWADVGSKNGGPIDGRADFCRVMRYGWSGGEYSLGCQIAQGENMHFTGAWNGAPRGDPLLYV